MLTCLSSAQNVQLCTSDLSIEPKLHLAVLCIHVRKPVVCWMQEAEAALAASHPEAAGLDVGIRHLAVSTCIPHGNARTTSASALSRPVHVTRRPCSESPCTAFTTAEASMIFFSTNESTSPGF